jgi:hypothetical protein
MEVLKDILIVLATTVVALTVFLGPFFYLGGVTFGMVMETFSLIIAHTTWLHLAVGLGVPLSVVVLMPVSEAERKRYGNSERGRR